MILLFLLLLPPFSFSLIIKIPVISALKLFRIVYENRFLSRRSCSRICFKFVSSSDISRLTSSVISFWFFKSVFFRWRSFIFLEFASFSFKDFQDFNSKGSYLAGSRPHLTRWTQIGLPGSVLSVEFSIQILPWQAFGLVQHHALSRLLFSPILFHSLK